MSASVKFLGTTDDVTTCDCCGRQDLKSTVALELEDGAGAVYFGVTCAAHALSRPAKEIRAEARNADRAREARLAAERKARFDEEFADWSGWLAANGTGDNVFTRIESLGGYRTARALYDSARAA